MLDQAAEADRVEPGDEGRYVEIVNFREFSRAQSVIAARFGPMISKTERNGREVRGFLAETSRPGVRGFDVAPGSADRARERTDEGQILPVPLRAHRRTR